MQRVVPAGLVAIRPAPAALLLLALCACEQGQENTAPGEMTVGEERALEDAASMLDESRVPGSPLGEEPPAGLATPAPQDTPP